MNHVTLATLTLVATLGLASGVLSHEVKSGDLTVIHPHIAVLAEGGEGRMAITNDGSAPDRLVSVQAPFAGSATLLQDGTPVAFIDLPPGATTSLMDGAVIRFDSLPKGLSEDWMLDAVLIFETAGKVTVPFAVEPFDPHAGHGGHDAHASH